jgi:DNA-binding MarR family transcriptional regulator
MMKRSSVERERQAQAAGQLLVPLELHDRADYLLCKLSDTVKREVDDAFGEFDVRGAHHALLRVLRANGPMPQHDMASHLVVDPSTIVDLVDHLERKGLVVRERNPVDRRAYLLGLTADGEQRLALADKRATTIQPEVFSALTEPEYEQLKALLLRMVGLPAE